ncbi:MAG: hypothetical protein Q9227_005867 [Pyrenula ochraceoflavens]
MSFRRRNIGLSTPGDKTEQTFLDTALRRIADHPAQPGVRPSPLDGRPTTSTGISTLDNLLAGHAGIPVGTSILVGENGTTDYGGALLRFYTAEGLVQGHHIHVLAAGEGWIRDLPAMVGTSEAQHPPSSSHEKMKIAWRYETLGKPVSLTASSRAAKSQKSSFAECLHQLSQKISSSAPDTVHRFVIPNLLSPALYPPQLCSPHHLIQFFHGLRSLLAAHSRQLTVMASVPLSLFPRASGLIRWLEHLSDCVVELVPFPHSSDINPEMSEGRDEQPQGLLKLHRLPIYHEHGGGGNMVGTDWIFTLSRRKLTIKPYNLPPFEGDSEAQHIEGGSAMPNKDELEF